MQFGEYLGKNGTVDWDEYARRQERNKMEKIWFISDTHFGHKNILKFCPNSRIGPSVEEHDNALIHMWQSLIMPNDRVYHLGDFFFCNAERAMSIMDRLPGQIHLIYGNHDKVIKSNKTLRDRFVAVHDYHEVNIDGIKVILFHFPILEFYQVHRGSFHLYGHVHGSQDKHPQVLAQKMMDVGIDGRPDGEVQDNGPMAPWSWEQVKRILSKRPVGMHHNKVMVE